jgi:hypothetical protein
LAFQVFRFDETGADEYWSSFVINEPLANVLPAIMPAAVAWAERMALEIARFGSPLNEAGTRVARKVGVVRVERVRILEVDVIPLPDDPVLLQVVRLGDFVGDDTNGLALGYGIFIRKGRVGERLIAHELRHVYQYEQAGSIADFLPQYLMDVAKCGYQNSRFEIDASEHEVAGLIGP